MDAMGYRFKKMIEQDPPQKITLTRHRSSEVVLFFFEMSTMKTGRIRIRCGSCDVCQGNHPEKKQLNICNKGADVLAR